MKGHDLGKGLTVLAKHQNTEAFMHADVDAWGAPSECHGDVSRGEAKRLRIVRKKIKAITGLKFRQFEKECVKRTSHRWMYIGFMSARDRLYTLAGYPF